MTRAHSVGQLSLRKPEPHAVVDDEAGDRLDRAHAADVPTAPDADEFCRKVRTVSSPERSQQHGAGVASSTATERKHTLKETEKASEKKSNQFAERVTA